MIYLPAEDSYLLENEIKKYLKTIPNKTNFKVLDMGSGSGIQAKAAISCGVPRKNVIAADINPEAIVGLKKQRIPARKTNLFSNINKNKKFNLIVFNAPYLPADKYDSQPDTTAGKKGYEIILKFLRKSKPYLTKNGVIILLFSSLSHPKVILDYAKKRNYNAELLAEKGVGMMETLFVYKFLPN
jgi:HemK-related putative methylase